MAKSRKGIHSGITITFGPGENGSRCSETAKRISLRENKKKSGDERITIQPSIGLFSSSLPPPTQPAETSRKTQWVESVFLTYFHLALREMARSRRVDNEATTPAHLSIRPLRPNRLMLILSSQKYCHRYMSRVAMSEQSVPPRFFGGSKRGRESYLLPPSSFFSFLGRPAASDARLSVIRARRRVRASEKGSGVLFVTTLILFLLPRPARGVGREAAGHSREATRSISSTDRFHVRLCDPTEENCLWVDGRSPELKKK